jgi:hypothetical protein
MSHAPSAPTIDAVRAVVERKLPLWFDIGVELVRRGRARRDELDRDRHQRVLVRE